MLKKIIVLFSLLFLSLSLNSYANQDDTISGKIISGYRVLEVDPANKQANLSVYRGDYIKFSFPQKYDSLYFTVPELKYKGTIFPHPDKSSFFKMKNSGVYSFTLGDMSGSITVVELVRSNYTEVTAAEGAALLQNLHPFILDVRTPQEYKQLHIEGTELIPVQQLQARIEELESKKHEDVFIYCATGNRSTVASRILANRGFKRIYNLRRGVYDWAQKGYPYVTGK